MSHQQHHLGARSGAGLLLVLVAACSTPGDAPTGVAAASPTASVSSRLSTEAEHVYQMTLVRDAAPPCATMTAGLADAPAALLEVAETVTAPPWSAVRAATCLVRHHAREAAPALLRWVRERRTMGLGLLTLNHIGSVEAALAAQLIASARTGEYAAAAERRIQRAMRIPAAGPGGVLQK